MSGSSREWIVSTLFARVQIGLWLAVSQLWGDLPIIVLRWLGGVGLRASLQVHSGQLSAWLAGTIVGVSAVLIHDF